ncbi:acyl carrier protein [Streptomyces sp. NPDC097617]|uniref:acyl carrier protein n=1 Tax=Streptomyces sp. NPDC097617 TaxID=3366091 RepID=UPI00381B34CF
MDAQDQDTLAYITSFLQETFGLPVERLTAEATFASLRLDSIAQVELFVTLSDRYAIHLDDSLASEQLTLGATAELVDSERARAGESVSAAPAQS